MPREWPPYMSTKMAAEYLGGATSPGVLANDRVTRRWSIPYIKIGRKVLYARADLDAFLDAHRVGTPEPAH